MKNAIRKVLSVVLATTVIATCFTVTAFAATPSVGVTYSTHVEDYGWMSPVSDGALSGTTGHSKRTEALKINLTKAPAGAHINYQVHVQDYGWMPVVSDGALAGTEGQSKRLEAIKISITGVAGYTIQYRVHVQDYGWMDWVSGGSVAGTVGQGKRIEAIQIRLVASVNSISITPAMTLIKGGTTGTITATVDPSGEASNIVWSSDKTAVATVQDGVVTPVTVGSATITASVGGKSATCAVSVQDGGSYVTSNLPADMTAYNAALAAVTEADYTTESWSAYQAVVAAYPVTSQNTQEEVNTATQQISLAQVDLIALINSSVSNDVATLGLIGTAAVPLNSTVVTAAVNITTGKIDVSSVGEGNTTITVSDGIKTATIYVSVGSDRKIYIITIVQYVAPDQFEPDNVYTSATNLPTDGTIQTHTSPANDSDWMKFDAVGGVAYTIKTTGLSDHMDTVMYLYAGDGTPPYIKYSDDNMLDGRVVDVGSTINYTPTSSGTYYILINGFNYYIYGQYDISITATSNMTAYNAALAAVTEAGYTTASWSAYQIVVAAHVVTAQNTQAEVNAATQAITDAQANLVAKANMTAYNAALAAVTEARYTTASWSAYQLVVAAHVVTNQNTQAEVDAATQAITDARVNLIPLVNSSIVNNIATLGLIGTSAATSNSAVATAAVNTSTGRIDISSVGPGTATITVTDGTNTASISVDVLANRSIIVWNIVPYVVGDQYEPDNSWQTARIITVGGTLQTHTISTITDEDWFKIDLTAGTNYEIRTSHLADSLNTEIYLYASDGTTVIRYNDDSDDSADTWGSVIFNSPMFSGTYYVKIQSTSHMTTGQYDISVTEP